MEVRKKYQREVKWIVQVQNLAHKGEQAYESFEQQLSWGL